MNEKLWESFFLCFGLGRRARESSLQSLRIFHRLISKAQTQQLHVGVLYLFVDGRVPICR